MFDISMDELLEGFEIEEVEVDEIDLLVDFVKDVKNSLISLQSKIISFELVPDAGNYSLWLRLTNKGQGSLNYTVSKDFDYDEFKFLLRNYIA